MGVGKSGVHVGAVMYMSAQVLLHVFMHLCGGQRSTSRVFFDYPLPYFFKHIFKCFILCVGIHACTCV